MKEDWGPKWLSKQKKNLSFEFNVPGEVLIALKQNLDVTKELCVSNRKSR
jgi:hypothetical protein